MRRLILRILAVTALAASGGMPELQPGAPVVTGRPNVLLVIIDTLRADHVGCYGDAGALDADARRSGASGRAVRNRRARAAHRPVARVDLTGHTPLGHGLSQ
jgi:hypothetical protein